MRAHLIPTSGSRLVGLVAAAALVVASHGCGDGGSDSNGGGPQIAIVGLKTGDGQVHGTTDNADPATMHVVLYAKTDQWYVQPFIASPNTTIAEDGTWQNGTHPWNHMLALLVDATYQFTATSVRHPASAPGVLAWDEFPTRTGERTIRFSDHTWAVKSGDLAGPGPNYFSDSEESVSVDTEGLHLAIRKEGDRWYTAEVFLLGSLGYGTYRFTVATPLNALDANVVFSGFTYESADRELDIEFSPFLADPQNAQYVVQPYTVPGNLVRFDMPGDAVTTHEFEWRTDHVGFRSWRGDGEPTDDVTIDSFTYTGANIPPPGGERMHFNYWLFGGNPPASGTDSSITVSSFRFVP
jgi:hypothetical protein